MRAFGLVALLVVNGGVKAEDAVIPPLGSNTELMQFYRMLPIVNLVPSPHSFLQANRPFKAISFDVEATPTFALTADDLSNYAGAAMQARLGDLGVDGEIPVLPRAWSAMDRPPDGLTHCDILHVMLLVTSAKMAPDGAAEMDTAAVSLFAWQDADAPGCHAHTRPAWAMQAAPRLILARHGDVDSLRRQIHRQILALVDWDLVKEVTRVNATADAAFKEMLQQGL